LRLWWSHAHVGLRPPHSRPIPRPTRSLGSAAASKTGTAQRLTIPPTMNAFNFSPCLNADAPRRFRSRSLDALSRQRIGHVCVLRAFISFWKATSRSSCHPAHGLGSHHIFPLFLCLPEEPFGLANHQLAQLQGFSLAKQP
jgi:hypothetical protein